MDKATRRRLETIVSGIADVSKTLAALRSSLCEIRDERQGAYDDMSESRQSDDAGEAVQSSVSAMEEALDAIDTLDLAGIARSVAQAGDVDYGELASPALGNAEAQARRHDRLPDWAKKEIARLGDAVQAADTRAAAMFGESKGAKTELSIDDYGDVLHGRVLPSRSIRADSLGITVSIDRSGRGLLIRGERMICVVPEASNTVYVRPIER